jgi:cyclophilin family peptidyl-prolyl cis-trans isomerase
VKRLVLLLLLVIGCPKPKGSSPDASTTTTSATTGDAGAFDPLAIARAEDMRRAKDIPAAVRASHDVAARRRSARALARIGDAASLEGLHANLADEDLETVAWGAYGLGFACKGHEDAHVKALAARAASLPSDAKKTSTARGTAEIDPHVALARAIGRCGGGHSGEQELVALLKVGGAWEEPALLGLGDLASRRKQLGAGALTALLDAATTKDHPPNDFVFYPLSRIDVGEEFGARVVAAAKTALAREGAARIFVVKALGRAPRSLAKEVAPELSRIATDAKSFTPAERGEAARALGSLGPDGALAAAEALVRLAPDRNDGAAIQALLGPEFHVLYTLIASLGAEPPRKAEATLTQLGLIAAPASPPPGLARRLAELRCAAALGLVRNAMEADVLKKCDADGSEIKERARLAVLLRRPLTDRKVLFRTFAKSEHLRVREAAIEAIPEHPELNDVAAIVLAEALASKKPGLVATAAEVVHMHPERAMVLAESEKKAALDPKSPPPSANPQKEISKDVGRAIAAALAEPWPEDRFETRIALLDAAAAISLPQAKASALAACSDANVVVREHAQKALRSIGESVAACNAKEIESKAAAEIGATITSPAKVKIQTDSHELSIVLEPDLAPITATRLSALVKSGFFKGIVVHRVVPGFVVQLGDPDGDGYGGSGTSLRCETSPVPFEPLDVGMALAGRDTGSSQFFVSLSRTAHLDGEYTRVGRAEGDWASVAQGDVVVDAKLVE